MIIKRNAEDRGHYQNDWLNSHHSFSFGNYQDSEWDSYRALQVINEDYIAPASGFDTHPHKDMEIFTYVVSGTISHEDSTGGKGQIKAGEIQLMTAGKGIKHSEKNEDPEVPVHLLQIWIKPEKTDLEPTYSQQEISVADKKNTLKLLASPDGGHGSLQINQDFNIYASLIDAGQAIKVGMESGRHVWVQVVSGSCQINGEDAEKGDGVIVSEETVLDIQCPDYGAELLLFDMA